MTDHSRCIEAARGAIEAVRDVALERLGVVTAERDRLSAELAEARLEIQRSRTYSGELAGHVQGHRLRYEKAEALLAEAERKLAAVEALPGMWERDACNALGEEVSTLERCARELQAALSPEGSEKGLPHTAEVEKRRAAEAKVTEFEDTENLALMLGRLLGRTADALKGPPAELMTHSTHDLPEVAERLRVELADAKEKLEWTRSMLDKSRGFPEAQAEFNSMKAELEAARRNLQWWKPLVQLCFSDYHWRASEPDCEPCDCVVCELSKALPADLRPEPLTEPADPPSPSPAAHACTREPCPKCDEGTFPEPAGGVCAACLGSGRVAGAEHVPYDCPACSGTGLTQLQPPQSVSDSLTSEPDCNHGRTIHETREQRNSECNATTTEPKQAAGGATMTAEAMLAITAALQAAQQAREKAEGLLESTRKDWLFQIERANAAESARDAALACLEKLRDAARYCAAAKHSADRFPATAAELEQAVAAADRIVGGK